MFGNHNKSRAPPHTSLFRSQIKYNNKVLLHERKTDTAHLVASAHYAALSPIGGRYPIQS